MLKFLRYNLLICRCWSPSSLPPLLALETCSPPWAQPGWPGNPKKKSNHHLLKNVHTLQVWGRFEEQPREDYRNNAGGSSLTASSVTIRFLPKQGCPGQNTGARQDSSHTCGTWQASVSHENQFGYMHRTNPLCRPAMMELKLIQSREDILSPPSSFTASLLWKYNFGKSRTSKHNLHLDSTVPNHAWKHAVKI